MDLVFSMVVEGARGLLDGFELLRSANKWPARCLQGGEGKGSPPLWDRRLEGWRQDIASSTRPEARGLGGLSDLLEVSDLFGSLMGR